MTQYNCLTYLLNLFSRGERFQILYNCDHAYAVQNGLIFDIDFKMRGDESKYLPLENCHEKEIIKKIFDLDAKKSKILDEYFAYIKNN